MQITYVSTFQKITFNISARHNNYIKHKLLTAHHVQFLVYDLPLTFVDDTDALDVGVSFRGIQLLERVLP